MSQVFHSQFFIRLHKIFLIALCFAIAGHCKASEESGKKFNPGELIMEHVTNNHEWHVWGSGENTVALPLPVILYTKDRGLTAFMSTHFHHGATTYNGYGIKEGKVVAVNELNEIPIEQAT